METGRSTCGFRLLAAVVALVSVAEVARAAAPGGTPGNQVQIVKVGEVTFELVRVPAGRFRMGSTSGDRDETPVHQVSIGHDFYLGKTEVTVRQFRAFVEATGHKTDAEQLGWAHTCPLPGVHPHQRDLDWRRPGFEYGDDHPAVLVSRSDAMAFCRWLSEQTGRTFRLPTEAEWEYAARAGRQESSADRLDDSAWHEGNAADCAHVVGTKTPNPWGLYDMQGNAWEWCLDVWRPDYCGVATNGSAWMDDPVVPPAAWRYVLRGGSWASPVRQLSLSYRSRRMKDFRRPDTGFRIVLSVADASRTREPAPDARSERLVTSSDGRPGENPMPMARLEHDSQANRTILTAHGARFAFVRIPAGEFMMGGHGEIEKPVHKVHIGYEFEMGTTEVTVGQFRAFIQATGYVTDGEKEGFGWTRRGDQDWGSEEAVDWRHATLDQSDDHPAVFISWYDAMAFCRWLSAETGQEIRLPSEAEWEHACRAGTTGLYAGELSAMGWSQYNACDRTHPVAQKQPNAWGLYDMHGNVWEWCLDFFATSYDGAPTDGRPRWDTDRVPDVISRGGSFINPPGWLASGCRMGTPPSASHYNNGFRLVRVLQDTGDDPARQRAQRSPLAAAETRAAALAPIKVEYPKPVFVGTPPDLRVPRTRPVRREAGPPFLAPVGTTNVALGKPVWASDEEPVVGALETITDGDKETAEGCHVELAPFLQHVTIDLQARHEIYGIQVWHYHQQPRVYFDVIVQIADDRDFTTGVQTIFNNDMDNSAGLGVGTDMHYVDTHFGELFDTKGARGRFVRLYSNGNSSNDQNHYTEIEVYGKPVDR